MDKLLDLFFLNSTINSINFSGPLQNSTTTGSLKNL